MEHLEKLHRTCWTCDYGVTTLRARQKGWLGNVPHGHAVFCCLLRISHSDPLQDCARWKASYDGYDAVASAELPKTNQEP
ncbi:hypothetical protein [Paucidesulfovibrio longus]|uniref:hypothetical protein n=1 Tax=Paucidesulfovibrio longus TaxID=889 RepID=UPI0003B3FB2A|nr:hypothetical protein [Paucidesulfovibrio longus]